MRAQILYGLLVATALILPRFAAAEPPAHAPAHGYRAQQKASERAPAKGGIEVIFDSERGIQVAVGLPDVLYHNGHYYRERDGRWEISLSGDAGWRISVASKIPGAVVDARKKSYPGPAKKRHRKHK